MQELDPIFLDSIKLEEEDIMTSLQQTLGFSNNTTHIPRPSEWDSTEVKPLPIDGTSRMMHMLSRAMSRREGKTPATYNKDKPILDLDRIQQTPFDRVKIEQLFHSAVRDLQEPATDILLEDAMNAKTFISLKKVFDIFIDEVRAEAWEQYRDWIGDPIPVPSSIETTPTTSTTTCHSSLCQAMHSTVFPELTPQDVLAVLRDRLPEVQEMLQKTTRSSGEDASTIDTEMSKFTELMLAQMSSDVNGRVSFCEFALARVRDRNLITDETVDLVEQAIDTYYENQMVIPLQIEDEITREPKIHGLFTKEKGLFDLEFEDDPLLMKIWFELNKVEPGPLPPASNRMPACSKQEWRETQTDPQEATQRLLGKDGKCRRFAYADEMTRCEVSLAYNLAMTCEGRKANWEKLDKVFPIFAISKGDTTRGQSKHMSLEDFIAAVKMLQIGKSLIKSNEGFGPVPQTLVGIPSEPSLVFAVSRTCRVESMTFDLSLLMPPPHLITSHWYRRNANHKEIELRWNVLHKQTTRNSVQSCGLYARMGCERCFSNANCQSIKNYNDFGSDLLRRLSGARTPQTRAEQNDFDYSYSGVQETGGNCVCTGCAFNEQKEMTSGVCKSVATGECSGAASTGSTGAKCAEGSRLCTCPYTVTEDDFWTAFYHYPKLIDGVSLDQLINVYQRMRHFRRRIPHLLDGLSYLPEVADPETLEVPEVAGWEEDNLFDFQMTDQSEVEDSEFEWADSTPSVTQPSGKKFVKSPIADEFLGSDFQNVPEIGWLLFYIVVTDYRKNANRFGSIESMCESSTPVRVRQRGGRYGCGPAPTRDILELASQSAESGDGKTELTGSALSLELQTQCRLAIDATIGPRVSKYFRPADVCQYLYLHTTGWSASSSSLHWPEPTGKAPLRTSRIHLCMQHTTSLYIRLLKKMSSALSTNIEFNTFTLESCQSFVPYSNMISNCEQLFQRYERAKQRCECRYYSKVLDNPEQIADYSINAAPKWRYVGAETGAGKPDAVCEAQHKMQPHKWVNLYFFTWNGGIGFRPRFDPMIVPPPPDKRYDYLPRLVFDFAFPRSNPPSDSLGLVHLGPPSIYEPDDTDVSPDLPPVLMASMSHDVDLPVLLPPSRDVKEFEPPTLSFPLLGPPKWLLPRDPSSNSLTIEWPTVWSVGDVNFPLVPVPTADFLPMLTPVRFQRQESNLLS